MVDTKFLSDGRKVSIIGKLNNSEWIVQEIFVTSNGDEIPSGESFTTKSIHDAPVESYFKREERRQKEYIEKAKNTLNGINRKIEEAQNSLKAKQEVLANAPVMNELFGERARLVSMFMTGTVKYMVRSGWELTGPEEMFPDIVNNRTEWGHTSFESIKLCSVLGRSNGDISFNVHQYCDGSGSAKEVYVFETHDDAVQKVKELAILKIERGFFSTKDIDLCESLKIKFDNETVEKIKHVLSDEISKKIMQTKDQIASRVNELEKTEELLNGLCERVEGVLEDVELIKYDASDE